MPSVTKMAAFHSATSAQRLKEGSHRTHPHPSPSSGVPGLPDVSARQQGDVDDPWSFLHTLLAQQQEQQQQHSSDGGNPKQGRERPPRPPRGSEADPGRPSLSLAPTWKRTKAGRYRLGASYDLQPGALTERQLHRYSSSGATAAGRGALTDRGHYPAWQKVDGGRPCKETVAGEERVHDSSADTVSPAGVGAEAPPADLDPLRQWTTCRALDDDDSSQHGDDAGDNDDDYGVASDEGEEEDNTGAWSRAASGNPSRRKRPLLLPPIMLPPVYAVKPTPLRLRDEPLLYMGARPRARHAVTDEEWDKLWDCRYLRIRTIRRPLKA